MRALTLFHSFVKTSNELRTVDVPNGSQLSLPLTVDNVSKETNQWSFVYLHFSIRV